jgi:phosphoribosylamine---glycine ligase
LWKIKTMNILLLGAGGREHAMAWKIRQSPRLNKLYIAPGNAGTAREGTNVNLNPNDFPGIGKFVLDNQINMVVVGPEDPLVHGIVDYFEEDPALHLIPVIGPSKSAARLEGSKKFAKEFMMRHHIPTAGYKSITSSNLDKGLRFLDSLQPPYVLKADGLAAGKGVLILHRLEEARQELKQMLEGKFGNAGHTVVIEEFLAGIELSVFVMTDGKSYLLLPEAKDYKRVGEGDSGPNTGGMGAISPVPFANAGFMKKVEEKIILPTIRGLQTDGIDYRGFIFFGLINCQGDPYVIEYNARLGDPETEAIMPRLQGDFIGLLEGVASRTLSGKEISIDPRSVTTVMLVSGGYPGNYEKGKEITGLDMTDGSILFHAGSRLEGQKVLTHGGRVMAISSYGKTFREAGTVSYKNAAIIDFENKYFRGDIGFDL